MSTPVLIPLAADGARKPCLVEQSLAGVEFDQDLQLNLTADGTPWHLMPQAKSCTDTNKDGQGDDVDDPYFAQASNGAETSAEDHAFARPAQVA